MSPYAYKKTSKTAWSMDDVEEEEQDKVEDVQVDKSDTQSENSTKSGVSQKRQKYEIYLKLLGMLFLPVVLMIVMATLVMIDYTENNSDRATVALLATYLRNLNAYTGRCQIERGTSSVYMGSGGTELVVELTERRKVTDKMGQELTDYLNDVKEKLPRSFLKDASGCRHFFMHDLAALRLQVDALDKKALGGYTAGIDKCHSLVARFPAYMDDGPKSGAIIAITTLLQGKELAGQCRAVVSAAMVGGSLVQANLVYQDTAQLRINSLLNAFVTSVADDVAKSVTDLVNSDVGKDWNAATQSVLDYETGTTFDGAERSADYFAKYSAFISALSNVISENVDRIETKESQAAYTAWLVCLLVTAGLTPVIAVWAGRAISVPFTRLETIKRKLKAEKTKHTLHNEAVTRFVPFETLELLGCTDITEVEVGTNQIRRMTIMFSYLHNFSLLASRLGADNIVAHLNQWLDGILPHIQRNRGLVDKFMGDGILAFFYKPEESIIAGIKMIEWLGIRNKEAAASGSMALEFGVGVNSGDVCIGTIGSDTRMTTTAIGDEVNVAARIQSCTKMYGTRLLISESAKNFANANSYSFRYLGQTTVKGRVEPVDIFENLDCLEPAELALKKQTNITFQAALKAVNTDPAQAEKCFREVLELSPNDKASQWYIKNITEGPQEFVK